MVCAQSEMGGNILPIIINRLEERLVGSISGSAIVNMSLSKTFHKYRFLITVQCVPDSTLGGVLFKKH